MAGTRRTVAAAVTAMIMVGLVSAASRPADAATNATVWTAADVFTASTPANPSSDAAGNPGVWTLAQGVGFDTGTYQPLTTYADPSCGFAGLRTFSDPSGLPSVGYNGTGRAIVNEAGSCATPFSIPAAGITVHPMANDVIVMWTSPIDGLVNITGRLFDADTNCGNGIGYQIGLMPAGGTQAATLTRGAFANGGSSSIDPSTTSAVAVTKGSRIILDVDDEGDTTCDLTNADLTIGTGGGSRYVALGDSFASGEGAEEAEFGDTTFPDPKVPGSTTGCHRSTTSWGYDVASSLLTAKAVQSWSLVACSGAVVDNLYAKNTTYQSVSGSPEPAQMSFVDRRTYRATLSIGGNDANFAPILRACVQYPRNDGGGLNCRKKNAKGRKLADEGMARLRDGIPVPSLGPGVVKPLAQVYFDIANRMAPGGRLVVAGYPKLFATSRARYDFGGLCKVGTGLGNVNVLMLYEDAQWLNGLTDAADSYIRSAVGDANRALNRAHSTVLVDYADSNAEFTDHRLCSGSRWFNGVELTFKLPPKPKQVRFHPNAKGQDAYARAVVPKAMVGVAIS